MERSKVPGTPRKVSWTSGLGRGGARRDAEGEADLSGVRDELKEIGPLHRIPAREDHHAPHGLDLPHQGFPLRGRELKRIAMGNRLGPAVLAHEIAGRGYLPLAVEG